MTSTTQTKDDKKKFANLLGPTDPKVDRDVREKLITARVGLLLRASFFGNLATRLKLVNADEWCGTGHRWASLLLQLSFHSNASSQRD